MTNSNSHTIGIQYSCRATFTLDPTKTYVYDSVLSATLSYGSLRELLAEYADLRKQVSNKVEDVFIEAFPQLNATRDTVYTIFSTYDVIYDSRVHNKI